MILVDANLLVYACAPTLPLHDRARVWLDARLNGPAQVGLPWASLLAFVRVVSNPRIFEPAETIAAAWGRVQKTLAHEGGTETDVNELIRVLYMAGYGNHFTATVIASGRALPV